MKKIIVFLLILLSSCTYIGPSSGGTRYDLLPEIKILNSNIWVTRKGPAIFIEHRLIYKLLSNDNISEVIISHILMDETNSSLDQKRMVKQQRSGIYVVTLEFKLPEEVFAEKVFYVETILETTFGSVSDSKPFTVSPDDKASIPGTGEKRFDIYKYLFSDKNICPPKFTPLVREITDADGNTENLFIECVAGNETENTVDEINIQYPETGNSYTIKRSLYPKFYRKLDRNSDGLITYRELGKSQRLFNTVTAKYSEGDIDSIVNEFMRRVK